MDSSDEITLMVDTNDAYQGDLSVFYIHPKRLSLLKCVSSTEFSKATIQFSPIDTLTSLNLSYVLRTLKPNSFCEVSVHQPISVMQDYDAKQIEANAKLAGFINFEHSKIDVENPKDKSKYSTILVTFEKPAKAEKEKEEDKHAKKDDKKKDDGKKKEEPKKDDGKKKK